MTTNDGISLVRRPISELIFEAVSEKIRCGELRPGAIIREKALIDHFDVGRMPVAVAISRLLDSGLVHRRAHMHGVVVGLDQSLPPEPVQLDELDLRLPSGAETALRIRNRRTLIYPRIEREIASCLLFGRFRIRTQAIAEHFGVSRTVANELLVRLERVGLVRQERNAHWYAGPLTSDRIRDLYEMRILLEPRALRQAAAVVKRKDIEVRLRRVRNANKPSSRSDTGLLHRLEVDLHHDIVLKCANEELRSTLYRCQLPLITVHLTFGSYSEESDIPKMIAAHEEVLTNLLNGKVEAAAEALRDHLQTSSDSNPQRLTDLRPLDRSVLSPYLDPA